MATKMLAIRIDEQLHARLSVVAQMEETTITDAMREAITAWIDHHSAQPAFQARAERMLQAIEEEAAARKEALNILLGKEVS